MASTRLPGKPLVHIGGVPLIVRCWLGCHNAELAKVYVAAADKAIVEAIKEVGGRAVQVQEGPTGTDQVARLVEKVDPHGKYRFVINVQGDMPFVPKGHIQAVADRLRDRCEMVSAYVNTGFVDAHVVDGVSRQFSRISMASHVGIYGYQRQALNRFLAAPQGQCERDDRLEQWRLIELREGYYFEMVEVPFAPLEVNTPQDVEALNAVLRQ